MQNSSEEKNDAIHDQTKQVTASIKALDPYLKAIDALSEWSGRIVSFLIYIGIAVLIYEVVLRYLFNAPTIWAHGMTQRIFATYYILLGAYALRQNAHVKIDVVYNHFSPRVRGILDMITSSLFFLFCGILLWKGIGFTLTSIAQLERDNSVFNAPIYPVKVMLPLGAILILLQGLAEFIRSLTTAITGKPYGR